MSRSLYARLAYRYGPRDLILSRRDALKAGLAASAALLLSGCSALARQQGGRASGKRIVVIGAGFGGLACAYELASAGYDVTIVEARNRLGGRVLSFHDMVPGKNVEGGGELIGSNHPTWNAYAERFQLEFLDVTEPDDAEFPILLKGRRLTAEESEALYEEMDAALALMNAAAADIDADQPWTAPDAERLDRATARGWIDQLENVSPLAKAGIDVQLMADNGVDTERQSFLGNLAQVKGGGLEAFWTDSEVYRCKGGNAQLADKLAHEIGRARLHLALPVRAVEVRAAGNADRVVVSCADGRTIEADDVVLAVPPSVWKKIDFHPPLPAALAPQMGTNVKYLAAVNGRFWLDQGLAADSLTDGDISMTWEATDNQPDGGEKEGGEGGQEDGGKKGGAVLTCFSGGSAAERARARVSEARTAAYHDELERLYPGFRDQFRSARFMDWPGDTWTQAGYSFPGPGQITAVGPLLRDGVGPLHFAGEHASYAFVGYMEGALNSGAALARRLAQRDGVGGG